MSESMAPILRAKENGGWSLNDRAIIQKKYENNQSLPVAVDGVPSIFVRSGSFLPTRPAADASRHDRPLDFGPTELA
jgi:hypothetical protein